MTKETKAVSALAAIEVNNRSICFSLSSPLRISRPKLMWIGENCVVDEKFLGVLIPNYGS